MFCPSSRRKPGSRVARAHWSPLDPGFRRGDAQKRASRSTRDYASDGRQLEGAELFEGAGGAEHSGVTVGGPDDLEARGKARGSQAAGDGGRRLARQIEGIGEG